MAKYVDYYDWKVQLAYNFKPGILKLGEWISISKKINGVRATFYDNNLISRSGKIFKGMDHIVRRLNYLNRNMNLVFDGELCLKSEYAKNLSDNEAFKMAAGIANSSINMQDKEKLEFVIFDAIYETAFETQLTGAKYSSRSDILNNIASLIKTDGLYHISVVPIMYQGKDHTKIQQCLDEADSLKWEGIMINRDLPYQFKRTKNILKYKSFNSADLEIVAFKEGEGKYANTLGAIGCKYKNNIVYVGTGFDDCTRDDIWNKRSELLGKICEVKYKDTTCDKSTLLPSLQFPVFVCIREDKEECNYDN